MEFDPTFSWGNVLAVAGILFSIVTSIASLILSRRSGVDKRLDNGSRRMTGIEMRVLKLELTISSLPVKEEVHTLSLSLSDITGELKGVGATLEAVLEGQRRLDGKIDLHEQYLRDKT